MVVRIGLVGQRADLAVEVASLAMRAGAVVQPVRIPLDGRSPVAGGPAEQCSTVMRAAEHAGVDLLLVDAAAIDGSGRSRVEPDDVRDRAEGRAATRLAAGTGPGGPETSSRGTPVAVVCRTGEAVRARSVAVQLGCSHVVELPLGASWLAEALAPPPGAGLLGVVGAVGGVGATTVAIACAVGGGPDCLLVDADPDSPGLDLALGVPEGSGARWAQIPDSSAPLDAGSLRASLPRVADVTIVTGPDSCGPRTGQSPPRISRISGVLGVGRAGFTRAVVDLGRGADAPSLLGPGDAVALVVPATVAGVVAGRRALERVAVHRVVILLRPTGWLPAADVAERLEVEVVVELPILRRAAELADCGDLLSGRTGRSLRGLGERVWELVR